MKKWEYDENYANWDSDNRLMFKERSNAGWELVSVCQLLTGGGGSGGNSIMAFKLLYTWKRPIQAIEEE